MRFSDGLTVLFPEPDVPRTLISLSLAFVEAVIEPLTEWRKLS